jgi:zinc protease
MKRFCVLFILITILLVAGCSFPSPRETISCLESVNPVASLADTLSVDPEVTIGILPNGITYYLRSNAEPKNRLELRLVVNAGSVLEEDDQQGLAHFLEHMAFNGTESFEKQELVDYLESIGMRFGPDLNAYTGFDETVYMLQLPTDSTDVVGTGMQILKEWAYSMTLAEEEIDRERGVIIEEWRLRRGADARIQDKQIPILFSGSKYAERLPIGKPEIIRETPAERLRRFYQSWYRPDLMAVVAVGDLDISQMEQLIRERFGGLTIRTEAQPRPLYPVPDHDETLFAIATDPEATSNSVSIVWKHDVLKKVTVTDYRRMIIESLYNHLLNQRLGELQQQADPPFLYGYSAKNRMVQTSDVYILGAQVPNNGIERGFETLLTEAARVRKYGFTATELERGKREFLRGMEQAYHESDTTESRSYAGEYVRHYLQKEPIPGIAIEYRLHESLLPGITLDEVNNVAARFITDTNRVIMVDGPEKEGVHIPLEDELRNVMAQIMRTPLDPYVDKVSDRPLVEHTPKSGHITEERLIEVVDVTEWRLSNGVRVLLKPTDFKNDEVLLTAYSPGGSSLVPDVSIVPAKTADTIISQSGVGPFTMIELEKLLADKVANVTPSIGELMEGLTGGASVRDLETMFQLIHLYFTSPRQDSTAYLSFKRRIEGYIENRSAQPEAAFQDTLSLTLTDYHPRSMPWTLAALADMDLGTSYDIYRDRFADASDFTFIIVGAFDIKSIRPLIETYLGGLPSTGRVETWRDTGIYTPEGRIDKIVQRGIELKSQVAIVYSGPFDWALKNRYETDSLVRALRIRLREVLREDQGGTYGVSVGLSLAHYPRPKYRVVISFGCDPDRVDALKATVFSQIDSIRAGSLSGEYLEKVTENQRRERETNLRENGFWRSLLQAYDFHGDDLSLIMSYDNMVNSLTLEKLKDTADQLFNTENVVTVTLIPEGNGGSNQ